MAYNNQTLASYQADILTAEKVREYIAGGRNKQARTIANNTTARILDDGRVAIRLHQTDIIVFENNGNITLNSGGWLSVTTKERLNRYTQAGITQKAGVWYMADGSLFYDGITITPEGAPLKPRQTEKYEKKLKAIKADAKQYAREFVAALKAGAIDYPSGGDCWHCSMRTEDGRTMGDLSSSSDHIAQHIKERYFVPSLLVNAGRAAGYSDMQIGLMGIGGQRLFVDPERVIYKYVVKQLQRSL